MQFDFLGCMRFLARCVPSELFGIGQFDVELPIIIAARWFCLITSSPSPSPSVGICSDQCRKAATIESVSSDGNGGLNVLSTSL